MQNNFCLIEIEFTITTYDLMGYVTSTLNRKSLGFWFFKNRLNIGSVLGNYDKSQFFLAINEWSWSFQIRDSKMFEILWFFVIVNLLTWSSTTIEIQFHKKGSIGVRFDFDNVIFFRKSGSYKNENVNKIYFQIQHEKGIGAPLSKCQRETWIIDECSCATTQQRLLYNRKVGWKAPPLIFWSTLDSYVEHYWSEQLSNFYLW